MVREIVEIYVKLDERDAFEKAIEEALRTITAKAKGALNYQLHRGIESPDRYVLQVEWATLEDHTVTYVATPEREVWRSMVTPFFRARQRSNILRW